MKSVICTKYGPPEVLQMTEVGKPVPKDNEVLIKIYATSAHVGDTRIRRADPFFVRLMFGLFRPKRLPVLGMELSGIIESVGKNVKIYKPGDEVFAFAGFGFGAYAEYICLTASPQKGKIEKEGVIALKPVNITHGEAATIPAGALTVLKVIQKTRIGKGHKILIYGASGSLGTYAVQMAKYLGAEVTGVCSTPNLKMVRSVGADHVIDYTREDFTQSGDAYDYIFDAVGKTSKSHCKNMLKKDGVFLDTNGLGKIKVADLLFLKDLIEKGKLNTVIDRSYPFEQIVEAHRYVDSGRKRGNVVISIEH